MHHKVLLKCVDASARSVLELSLLELVQEENAGWKKGGGRVCLRVAAGATEFCIFIISHIYVLFYCFSSS